MVELIKYLFLKSNMNYQLMLPWYLLHCKSCSGSDNFVNRVCVCGGGGGVLTIICLKVINVFHRTIMSKETFSPFSFITICFAAITLVIVLAWLL